MARSSDQRAIDINEKLGSDGLRKPTWAASAIVFSALIAVHFEWRCLTEDFRTFCNVYYGWPVYAVRVTDHYPTHTRTHDARLIGVAVDSVVFSVLMLSTVLTVERCCR